MWPKVVGAALDAPMFKERWTCDFFKESKDFKKAEIMQSYGAGPWQLALQLAAECSSFCLFCAGRCVHVNLFHLFREVKF